MIDDFYGRAWAECHEKFSAEVSAGFGRLIRWLRRRDKAPGETPADLDQTRNDGNEASGEDESTNSRSAYAEAEIAPEPATSGAAAPAVRAHAGPAERTSQ